MMVERSASKTRGKFAMFVVDRRSGASRAVGEHAMAVGWRIGMPAFLLALALSMAAAPAGAQTGDIAAIQKSYNQLFAAGEYAAALVEAQKLEALAKERFGNEHAVYATAIQYLAVVYKEKNEVTASETRHKREI